MMGPLIVVGSVNADLVVQIDRLPKPGETLAASTLETFPGGKAWSCTPDLATCNPMTIREQIKLQLLQNLGSLHTLWDR